MKNLPCGHPGKPENLIDGKCGACKVAADFDRLAKGKILSPQDKKLRECCSKMAKLFRSGGVVIDKKKGKPLSEWSRRLKRS